MVTKLTGKLPPLKNYFLRRLLLQKGYPPEANAMARAIALASDYDESRCRYLLSHAEELTLQDVSNLCNKLSIPYEDFFLYFTEKKSVAPFIAKHAYTLEPLTFYVPNSVADIPCGSELSWFSGLSFQNHIISTDIVIFDSNPIAKPDTEQLHLFFDSKGIFPGIFHREKNAPLQFFHDGDRQISFPTVKRNHHSSIHTSFHRIVLTINASSVHSNPPT